MLTDIARRLTPAAKFVLWGVAGSLAFFGLLRLRWTEAHLVLPLTRLQGESAVALFGTPALPVEVTLACSGTDVLALSLGAVLAYPVTWRMRLAGAGGGIALILGLNTLRIGTLGQVVASPAWFNVLHVYVWPAALLLAIAGYVFAWMRLADLRPQPNVTPEAPRSTVRTDRAPAPLATAWRAPQPSRRFIAFTVAFLVVFAVAAPFYLESPSVLALAGVIAGAAAALLGLAGVSAHAAANVLWTTNGGFLVTQECITTPLIPIYLAAVSTYSTTWRRLIVGVLATLPIFVALGTVRLLVVALPASVGPAMFFVHSFYQLLLGAVVVLLAALWRRPSSAALGYALAGGVLGVAFVYLFGPSYTRLVTAFGGAPLEDPQGAIALLPSFQVGLYLALSVAVLVALSWPRFFAGLALLGLTQTAGLLALHAVAGHFDVTATVRDIRGWAVVGPVLIFAAVVNVARTRR